MYSSAESVLIITKARDNNLVPLTRELTIWLMTHKFKGHDRGLIVYVDEQLRQSKRFDAAGIRQEYPDLFNPVRPTSSHKKTRQCLNSNEGQLRYWNSKMCTLQPHLFDFVITLGGDGTVLFSSWIFQSNVPPVIPFSLGSLGFLTPFSFDNYKPTLEHILSKGTRLHMRMRFRATVYRAMDDIDPATARQRRIALQMGDSDYMIRNISKRGWCAVEMHPGADGLETPDLPVQDVHCFKTAPVESFEFLNDLVVDRGPSPYVTMLEVFSDDSHLTTAHADGLCIATPTGSTAYSLSAGGSLVHPSIPAMLITPICAHTLSFRPMLVPDTMELRIAVPFNSRSNAWASFDGRGRIEIRRGDHIKVTASPYPFPTVSPDNHPNPWFDSVSRTLNWNQRKHQMGFVTLNSESSKKGQDHRDIDLADVDSGEESDIETDPCPLEDKKAQEDEEFDIDEHTPSVGTQSLSGGGYFGSAQLDSRSDSSSAGAVPIYPNDPRMFLQRQDVSNSRSPDRYGPSGPPPAPGPLSERHMATVNFRLHDSLYKDHAKSFVVNDIPSNP